MRNLLKKFVLSFLSALILLFSVAPYYAVEAQEAPVWYDQDYKSWLEKVDGAPPEEIFGERYTSAQVQWVIYGFFTFILNAALRGSDNRSILGCIITNTANLNACAATIQNLTSDSKILSPFASTGTEPTLWSQVFSTDRPVSGIAYTKNLVQKFSLVAPAKAQTRVGYGFSALQPIQSMWRASRNVAYSLFTLVAVILAFLIMFRVKLSPQTVITVQSAIPKIAFALITVTFSYAIAGFMIDFMYVVIGLMSVIGSSFFTGFGAGLVDLLSPPVVFRFLTLGQPFLNSQAGILPMMSIYVFAFANTLIIVMFAGSGIIGSLILFPIIMIISLLVIIIGLLVALWTAFKTFWTLLKTFVNIILLTIFAPIQLSIGALIPTFGFGAWIRSYLAALSTFVVVGVLMLFSYIFLLFAVSASLNSINFAENFAAALLQLLIGNVGANAAGLFNAQIGGGPAWPPLLGLTGNGVGILFLGVSFVMFTMIPKAAEITQALISGKPFAFGSAIGETVGFAKTVGVGALAYHVGKDEDARLKASQLPGAQPYQPRTTTQILRSLGILK